MDKLKTPEFCHGTIIFYEKIKVYSEIPSHVVNAIILNLTCSGIINSVNILLI